MAKHPFKKVAGGPLLVDVREVVSGLEHLEGALATMAAAVQDARALTRTTIDGLREAVVSIDEGGVV